MSSLWILALLGLALQGSTETWGAKMCAEQQPRFLRRGNPHPAPQVRVGENEIALLNRERFPLNLPGINPFNLGRHKLTLYDFRGAAQFEFTLPMDGDGASIARVAASPDHFVLWAYADHRNPETRQSERSYQRWLVDMAGNATDLAGPSHFEPLAINSTGDLLASLATRVPIMGGQRKEEERPPQKLRIESLTAMNEVASVDARRVLGAYFDDTNHLFLLRWEGEYVTPYSTLVSHVVLDKYASPRYELLWSTTATLQPTPQGSGSLGPHVLLTPGSTIRLAYADEAPGLITQIVKIDAKTGRVLHRNQEPYSMVGVGRHTGQEVAGFQWRHSGTRSCLYEI